MGIPLVAGVVTRYSVWALKGKEFLNGTFLPSIAPISLLGLLYAILVLSAYQAHRFIRDITPLIRVLLPLALYSVIMFSSTLAMMFSFSKREGNGNRRFAYDVAVVQAFTASSNNFVSFCPSAHSQPLTFFKKITFRALPSVSPLQCMVLIQRRPFLP
jgi:ACR3 family arsenite transporter